MNKSLLLTLTLIFLSTACVDTQFAPIEMNNSEQVSTDILVDNSIADEQDQEGIQPEQQEQKQDKKEITQTEQEQVTTENDSPLTQELSNNTACQGLLDDSQSQNLFDGQGQSYRFTGNIREVAIKNVDVLTAHGNIRSLTVDRSNEVFATGNLGDVCIRTRYVDRLSGNLGNSHLAVFGLSTEEISSQVNDISGNARTSMVLVNVNVEKISGNFKVIHLYGGTIELITGNGQEIHLYNGAKVVEMHGHARTIIQH